MMDFSNQTHQSQPDSPTKPRESHWQPALRPNDEDINLPNPKSIPTSEHPQNMNQSSIASQSPENDQNERDEASQSDGEGNDGLDPAWGIKRTDSAHILDTVRRSTSFPRPALDYATFSPPPETWDSTQSRAFDPSVFSQSVPQTQLEDVMYEDEDSESALFNARDITGSAQEQHPVNNDPSSPNPEESRYEEGIPLIQESQVPHLSNGDGGLHTLSAFDNLEETNDDTNEFFSQVQPDQSSSAATNPGIERKDTEEVLGLLQLGRVVPDSPPPKNDSQPQIANVAPKEKDLAEVFGTTSDAEEDPWKAVLGDDDEFLVEDADDLLPESDSEPEISSGPVASQTSTSLVQKQRNPSFPRRGSNMYAPHQPSTSELAQLGATTHNSIGLTRQMNPPAVFQPPQHQQNITNRAASFADQAKDGYKSPYDLPMDLAPKRKTPALRPHPQLNSVPPPPRSSSISVEKHLQSPFSPVAPASNFSGTMPPPATTVQPAIDRSASVPVKAQQSNQRNSSGFFEELPMATRSRPIPAAPRVPTTQTPVGPPRQIPSAVPNNAIIVPPVVEQVAPRTQDPYAQYQLRQPEKLDPYANVASQTIQAPQPPAMNSRYSPAPPVSQTGIKPSPSPRYSPAPPQQANSGHNRYVSQPTPPTSTLPFQPRTSSPLAQHRKSADRSAELGGQQRPMPHHSTSSSVPFTASFQQSAANTLSPPRQIDPSKQPEFVPPRRSQTQSPSRQVLKPNLSTRVAPPPNRPASAFGQTSPTRTVPSQTILSPPQLIPRPKFVEEVEYIAPNDGTENDPLQRWKGTPIFRFGFGGTVVSSFPRRTPRFSSAATRPQMKVSAGEVSIKKLDEYGVEKDRSKKFPGPLKGKSKKKDVIGWLASTIEELESENMSFPSKRLEEKILLWKIVRVLVNHDGNLEGAQSVQSVSEILMPSVYSSDVASSSQYQSEDITGGIYRPASITAKSETVDPVAVENLRKTLLKGKREDAVWQAVDNRLWSHAFLLSSTLDKSVWKQVVQEFVKQEVKTISTNAESLCALYEIFGGNLEESVDQLVPPSARAGLQMVSKADVSGPARNALDGLDKWRETLCLVLNNRSHEDQRALITLARLLSDYGRVEAAHICYLFARNINLPNMFGGADDPNSFIVLLGADHRHQPLTFHQDMDAILLSEVLEFAISTLATSSSAAPMPHLAAYKLHRANILADVGMKTEAQAYCEAVASGLKSSTKHSLYYHPILLGEVEDLSNRLKQIPVQSSSWMAKPSIEKASTSVWNKFSSFVTGEDSDAESKGSVRDATEAGPFANVSGSPTLSRNTSQTDLYGSYPTMTPTSAPATATASRYAPNGLSSARSSTDLPRARMSFDSQRSPPSTSHSNEGRGLYAPVLQPQQSHYSPQGVSPQPTGYQPNLEMHMPPVAEETQTPQHSSYAPQVSQPALNNNFTQPSYGMNRFTADTPPATQDSPLEPISTFEPNQNSYGGYEPPEDTGYVPYQPEADSDDDAGTKSKPRKKSFMDDDDGNDPSYSGKASLASNSMNPSASANDTDVRRKANDEAADAAFRAAAEADAKAAAEAKAAKKASGSWLGGWFSGSKKPDSLDASSSKSASSSTQKVHRVHLGESKMKLYYDENKKKWINPDNPEASEKKTLAPPPRGSTGSAPPPMMGAGGPPRSVSTPHSLPVGGISRSGTPASVAVDSEGPDSRPGSSHISGATSGFAATLPPGTKESLGLGSTPLPTPPGSSSGPPGAGLAASGAAGHSGPPSRPGSALSNASGLDDLLGPPTGARKVSGRGAKGKKGRYVDVMAK